MTAEEKMKYKAILEQMRREITRNLPGNSDDNDDSGTSSGPGSYSDVSDFADQGSMTNGLDDHFRNMERAGDTLFEIDDALRRISDDHFGICQNCNQPIAEGRLEAIPYVLYCLKCQSEFEADTNSRYTEDRYPNTSWFIPEEQPND